MNKPVANIQNLKKELILVAKQAIEYYTQFIPKHSAIALSVSLV